MQKCSKLQMVPCYKFISATGCDYFIIFLTSSNAKLRSFDHAITYNTQVNTLFHKYWF